MASRLNEFKNQLAKSSHVSSSFDYLNFSEFFSEEENEMRLKIRDFLTKEVVPTISDYVERAQFPEAYIPKMRDAKIIGHFINKPYGFGSKIAV